MLFPTVYVAAVCPAGGGEWTTGELQTSSKGQKSAPVFCDGKPAPHLQLCLSDRPMHAPFGASAFGDVDGRATRLNCELDCSAEQAAMLAPFDEWVVQQAKNSG